MKKVIYSVKKLGKFEVNQISGIGYITQTDLITSGIGKNGKSYVRIFEDSLRYCHQVLNRPNEYKGIVYEIHEILVETKNGSTEYREITFEYEIWYKLVDER